jgi:GNAT superfamily N-acetyltransferase
MDGEIRATATAICYGTDLAWIGMVLTDPEYRGRGMARRLMERAIRFCEDRGVHWIKLDATDMGRPLYVSLGFEDEGLVERWAREPGEVRPVQVQGVRDVPADLDREAFGADRRVLLEALARDSMVMRAKTGYAMGRGGANAAYFGPCVTRSASEARIFLEHFLAADTNARAYWDVLAANDEAVRLATEFGFTRKRTLWRMQRPGVQAPRAGSHDNSLVYAIAGFEYG